MVSRARATRGLRRPSLDTRSGKPSSPPSRENIEARGRSTCAVGDNPDHLLKTVEESRRAGQQLPQTAEPVPGLRVPVSLRVCTLSRRTFMNNAGQASHRILSHYFNRAQERAGGSPQPTTSLPCESEQYPIAVVSRQQDEVHTLRLAEN